MNTESKHITCIVNDGISESYFSQIEFELSGDDERMLSDRINAENFRLRASGNSYCSNWHVAGDPTLLVILKGSLRIELHTLEYRDFSAGDMFIAKDYINDEICFDSNIHGHRAKVLGHNDIYALHIKLEQRK